MRMFVSALAALSFCVAAVAAEPAPPAAADALIEPAETFEAWRKDFTVRAIAAGHEAKLVKATLAGVEPNPALIALDRSQPEFVRPIWTYLANAVSPKQVATGQTLFGEEAALFAALSAQYGVAPEVLAAIWGIESAFGAVIGDFDVVASLATLAWEGRRRELFESELLAVFTILSEGHATRAELVGGWAGAMGQTQFMPSAYLREAVDQDGDGKRDVWGNRADALASAASYLAKRGWVSGKIWGREVRLPPGFDHALADGRRMTAGGWAALGVTRMDDQPWDAEEQFDLAELLLPAGARGAAFLVFENFDVIRRYNASTAYALAVGALSDQIAGRPGVKAAWPVEEPALARLDVETMQRALVGLGFPVGEIDGKVGPNTRAALRAWQSARGLVADAFPTVALITQLKAEAGL